MPENGVAEMYQDIEDDIDVIALFEGYKLRPLRFRWNNRVYKITRVTGDWKSDVGQYKLRHFAVLDDASNFFQISYDEKNSHWLLTKLWVE